MAKVSKRGRRFIQSWGAKLSLDDAEMAVSSTVRVPLAQAQFDALASLVSDVGPKDFAQSLLIGKLNRGDRAGAAAEFGRWNGEDTAVRRGAERALFINAEYRLNK